MSADYFLDSNILVYAFDKEASEKREIALSLIKSNLPWTISWQVVQEFSSVGLHKFKIPLEADFLQDFLEHVLWPHCVIFPGPELYRKAIEIHVQTQYRFHDCLILASALESGASILYSEDLQDGRSFGHLQIVNPFVV